MRSTIRRARDSISSMSPSSARSFSASPVTRGSSLSATSSKKASSESGS